MRPVSDEFPINQPFGSMKTAGVVGNINASQDTVEYYVGKYGNYQPDGHAGCDIACPVGTPVHAMAAGTVLWADWGTKLPGDDSWGPSGYFARWALYKGFPGIVTVIQHDGFIGVYAHLSEASMNPGDAVSEGRQIGLSGNTGGVAPHLHVEALIDLSYSTGNGLIYGRTNPEPFFGGGGISAQSTTTKQLPAEDDVITPEDIRAIEDAIMWGKRPKYNAAGQEIGTTTLGETIAWQEANFWRGRQFTLDAVKATVLGVLTTPVKNVATGGTTDLGTEVSWLPQNFKRDSQGQIDVEALATTIATAVTNTLNADTK